MNRIDRRIWRTAAAAATTAALAVAWGAMPAHAVGAAATSLIETESVQAPRGFTELCRRNPEFCPAERVSAAGELDRIAGEMARLFGREALALDLPVLTQERLNTLERVNQTVNMAIQPVDDRDGDVWSFSAIAGDCEEYVIMKREMLARMGWPRAALRITVVHDGAGYHAILVAETAQGGVILDNMTAALVRVEDSPYEFIVAQSAQRPGEWVRVQN